MLFVDDDAQVRRAFGRIMERAAIPVTTADSADEALRLLEEDPRRYGVVATDYQMPGKTGVDLLQAVSICAPWSTRILVSGHLAVEPLLNAINHCGVSQVVTKPWKPRDLERAVRRGLDRANLALRHAGLMEQLKDHNRDLRRRVNRAGAEELLALRPFCEKVADVIDAGEGPASASSAVAASLARLLAQTIGLSPREVLEVELGSLVADIGRLLPERREEAGSAELLTTSIGLHHPSMGHQILAALPGFQGAALVVLHHHERFDGARLSSRAAGSGDRARRSHLRGRERAAAVAG
ncbi:MAG: response regulator, partial [Myxococcales bacterium]|nr:response regulator [Myxococcales bacterium]